MKTNILSLCLLLTTNFVLAQVNVKIDPTTDLKPVSPYLYGRNNSLSSDPGKVLNINWTQLKDAGVMMFRENGGNNATKYNWRRKLSSHPIGTTTCMPTTGTF
jgi:hypothetical protein